MRSIKVLLLLASVFLMITNSAYAISMSELNFDQDYWSITDHTTNVNGSAFFQLEVEQASYESDFGLYYVNDTGGIVSFQIFDKTEEPISKSTITFQNTGSGWNITDSWTGDSATTSWTAFNQFFGFYYEVYTGGANDTESDFIWYTDLALNVDGVEHIGTVYNVNGTANIYLDDQYGGGDRDFTDMTVFASDVSPAAPVPEPATMLLLGTGLVGLAGFGRKKFRK